MNNPKREIRVIEEIEQVEPDPRPKKDRDSSGPDGQDSVARSRVSMEASSAGFVDDLVSDPQVAMPFSTDGLRGIDSEDYLGGTSLGVTLRQARLKRKLQLEDVASVLRIRKPHLQAIEQGNYSSLPGPTYAVGFVRAYAAHLDLDPEEAVQRYKMEAEDLEVKPELCFPKPEAETRLPGMVIVVGSLFAALAVYGIWQLFSGGDSAPAPAVETASTVEATGAEETASAASPAAPGSAATMSSGTPTAITEALVAEEQTESAAVLSQPAAPAQVLAEEPAQEPATVPENTEQQAAARTGTNAGNYRPAGNAANSAGTTASQSDADATAVAALKASRVVVTVSAESWVQVRNAEGAVVFTRLMAPGDVYKVPSNRKGFALLTGNAGALQVSVDGEIIPPLGASGEVVRNISLDAENLLVGTGAHR